MRSGSKSISAALKFGILLTLVAPVLAACSGGVVPDFINSTTKFTESQFGKASPRVTTSKNIRKGGGRAVVGKPYKVAGRWYKPERDPNYDKTGSASWYGPNFHGRQTANGEIFDQFAISAAHPTLPLPSYVRVTNLANNRSIVVRVNDRGPFVHGREIDLSARAADMLGYREKGIARVRVKYVAPAPVNGDDTKMLLASYNKPTHMERGQRSTTRVAAIQPAPKKIIQPVTPSAPKATQRTLRGTVAVNSQGFNIVTSPSTSTGLGPLFYNAQQNGAEAELALNAAFAATDRLAKPTGALHNWQSGVDADARKVKIGLGTFSDPQNAQNVIRAFSLIGAVDETFGVAGKSEMTTLKLSQLKPGVTRADVAEIAATLGLAVQIEYE